MEPTPLDRVLAQAQVEGTDTAWTRFYQALSSTRLFVAAETAGEKLRLSEVETETGRTVLGFDRIERLSAYLGGPAEYAEIPGSDLAAALAEQGIGLTLNLGTHGETMLDPDRLGWLAMHFGAAVSQADAAGVRIGPPGTPSPELMATLGETVGALGHDCPEAWLVGMTDDSGLDELVLVLGLSGDAARMEGDLAEAITRAGQAVTDRRFAVACPDRGAPLMATARREGIGIGGGSEGSA